MSGPWERRWHPLLDEWAVISSSSAARPWSGARSSAASDSAPEHDPDCYLCPGVTRANGCVNAQYSGPYAFDNDFPTFAADAPVPMNAVDDAPGDQALSKDPFAITASAKGQCRVLCWSDRHDVTLADLPSESMAGVAKLWQQEFNLMKSNADVKQVLMFENKGVEIGVSNLHPHGQAYGLPFVASHAKRMRNAQARYAKFSVKNIDTKLASQGQSEANEKAVSANRTNRTLLIDMLSHESVQGTLIVEQTQHWSVVVPFAARFAYETWIVPHKFANDLSTIDDQALKDLAEVYQRQAQRYDILFQRQSPNITHFHNAPCDSHADNKHWCFHMAFQPPLREPDKLKYLGGFESAAGNITNPVQPEVAAARLKEIKL